MKKRLKRYIWTPVVGVYAIVTLYPLIWMVFQSLKSDQEFYMNQYAFPKDPLWENYASAWEKANFASYFQNSIIVTGISLIILIFTCSLAAYAFSKIKFRGSNLLMGLLMAVLFLPSTVLSFPVYTIVKQLGIDNTYIGLIGPYVCGSVPISIMVLKSAYDGIPTEIAEAAKLDGCNEFQIWWRVMFPLVKSAVATIAILAFVAIWNEYQWALISVSDESLYTLPVGISYVSAKIYSYGYGTVFAGMVMVTVPVIILYLLLQKHFVKAISAGAVKG